MGGRLSCFHNEEIRKLERLQYDMSPIKTKPIIWLLGPPGAGRNTQARLLSEILQFEDINVPKLIKDEISMNTKRGDLLKDKLEENNNKISDMIIIDLIKEKMLGKSRDSKGFIINNFPKTNKQAMLFIKEINNVDIIVYLSATPDEMLKRYKMKVCGQLDDTIIIEKINNYTKEIMNSVSKFGNKLANINADDNPEEVYRKIESLINTRIGKKMGIVSESDYAQSVL